jgi:phosphohistidine swiveling domain-containing protein
VADGFCITTAAYGRFLQEKNLADVIRMELGRKPFATMRWEEIWDTALRIRSAFLSTHIPAPLSQTIRDTIEQLGADQALAVRSSAPGEDSVHRSFAGLHESVVNVIGAEAVLDAVRIVWASLWSDAALLYRQELALDFLNPAHSRMAVVVQKMINEDRSGVAFGRDPRDIQQERAIIEAVPGPCSDLVDGLVDPDHWILKRATGQILEWHPGDREQEENPSPILNQSDLDTLLQTLFRVESLLGWPPDVEWTGRNTRLTLLQARPITGASSAPDDKRRWYLSLRPRIQRLRALAERVSEELIPQLERLGQRLATEAIESYTDKRLADAITERQAVLKKWEKIYWDAFIPLAHGVRQLGLYYNDAVHPEDPYEFVGLLKGKDMMAQQRNQALADLASQVWENTALQNILRDVMSAKTHQNADFWPATRQQIEKVPGGHHFAENLETLLTNFMDVAYENERLSDRPDQVLSIVLEMATARTRPVSPAPQQSGESTVEKLTQRLLDAVGPARRDEALEVIALGRLSWRLRDDDNVLLGRVESQFLRALNLGADRLRRTGRLRASGPMSEKAAPVLATALQSPSDDTVTLPPIQDNQPAVTLNAQQTPRQLIGQPASPGLATGHVRVIKSSQDLGRFRAKEVLVCDAIQPTMTHLVPLANAVVERRGGMLIHGAIIARELGIPCVNGVANAADVLKDGQWVTVDGYLGIVTVGPPDFELERG